MDTHVQEWVDVGDADNKVIDTVSRQQVREENLCHRATYIIVHDGMGHILVQRRTDSKDFYPGWLDVAAGGVVSAGESLTEGAKREAEEELGIAGIPFLDHGSFYYESEDCKVWGGLFSCISRGPFALQESEITEVMWMSLDEINQRRREITPDTRVALDLWLNRNGTDDI